MMNSTHMVYCSIKRMGTGYIRIACERQGDVRVKARVARCLGLRRSPPPHAVCATSSQPFIPNLFQFYPGIVLTKVFVESIIMKRNIQLAK